jgi:hypothetical protein
MAKKKKKEAPRVASVDEMGVLKRDLGKTVRWTVVSVVLAVIVAVGVENFLL